MYASTAGVSRTLNFNNGSNKNRSPCQNWDKIGAIPENNYAVDKLRYNERIIKDTKFLGNFQSEKMGFRYFFIFVLPTAVWTMSFSQTVWYEGASWEEIEEAGYFDLDSDSERTPAPVTPPTLKPNNGKTYLLQNEMCLDVLDEFIIMTNRV